MKFTRFKALALASSLILPFAATEALAHGKLYGKACAKGCGYHAWHHPYGCGMGHWKHGHGHGKRYGHRMGYAVPHHCLGYGTGHGMPHHGHGYGMGHGMPHHGCGYGMGHIMPHHGHGYGMGYGMPHCGHGYGRGYVIPYHRHGHPKGMSFRKNPHGCHSMTKTGGYGYERAKKGGHSVRQSDDAAASEQDIVGTAVSAGNFTTLIEAVKAAGLVETLRGEGPFTVFAPTDEAFAKLPADTLNALLKDREQLTAVLTYHVVPGLLRAASVASRDTIETVQGQSLTVTADDAGVRVDEAQVTKTDIYYMNYLFTQDPIVTRVAW